MKTNRIYRGWLPFVFILVLAAVTGSLQPVLAQRSTQHDPPDNPPVPRSEMEDQHGYLGVTLMDLTDDLRKEANFQGQGVMVDKVVQDSPAEKADVRENDIITRFNGQDVDSEAKLRDLITQTKPGDRVEVQVFRNGATKNLSVTMGSTSEAMGGPMMQRMMGQMRGPMGRMMKGMPLESNVWLGVQVMPLTDQLRQYFQVKGQNGMLISEVEDQSPAQKAGLKAGDVITRVESSDVTRRADIITALSDKKPGDVVNVEVVRGGRIKTMKVTVAEVPESYRSGMLMPEEGGSMEEMPMPPGGMKMYTRRIDTEDSLRTDRSILELNVQMQQLQESLGDLQRQLEDLRVDFTRFRNQFR